MCAYMLERLNYLKNINLVKKLIIFNAVHNLKFCKIYFMETNENSQNIYQDYINNLLILNIDGFESIIIDLKWKCHFDIVKKSEKYKNFYNSIDNFCIAHKNIYSILSKHNFDELINNCKDLNFECPIWRQYDFIDNIMEHFNKYKSVINDKSYKMTKLVKIKDDLNKKINVSTLVLYNSVIKELIYKIKKNVEIQFYYVIKFINNRINKYNDDNDNDNDDDDDDNDKYII